MQRKPRFCGGVPAAALPRLAVAVFAAWSCAACSGSVEGPGADDGDGGGSGGTGGDGQAPIAGPIPETKVACAQNAAAAGPSHWRRLTALQYKNTVKDLLGQDVDTTLFLSDTTTGRFTTNTVLATPDAQVLRYQDSAAKVAAAAVQNLSKLTGCAADDDACAAAFIDRFVGRAWRRPATDEDRQLLHAVYKAGKQSSFATGIRLVVEAVLQSPSFLYLVETGTEAEPKRLTAYEAATRLSYVLWNTMPDEELFSAAAAGDLDKAEGVRKHAERMMNDPRFGSALVMFHEQLLGTDALTRTGGVARDPKRYPQWTDALKSAMRDETGQFVRSVFMGGEGTLQELLLAPFGFASGPLADIYASGERMGSDGKVVFRDGSRHGILTQAATLSAADPADSLFRAVLRGKLLRTEIFCESLPAVPGNVEFKQPEGADQMTQQELLRVHQEEPSCKGCHEQMDPLGFALESYDGIGRHRTKHEDGDPVDTSGTIVGTDVEGSFANTTEFLERVASSRDVRSCFARQWFKFTLGRDPAEADACSLAKTRDILSEGGGNLREAIAQLVSSDSFRYLGGR